MLCATELTKRQAWAKKQNRRSILYWFSHWSRNSYTRYNVDRKPIRKQSISKTFFAMKIYSSSNQPSVRWFDEFNPRLNDVHGSDSNANTRQTDGWRTTNSNSNNKWTIEGAWLNLELIKSETDWIVCCWWCCCGCCCCYFYYLKKSFKVESFYICSLSLYDDDNVRE